MEGGKERRRVRKAKRHRRTLGLPAREDQPCEAALLLWNKSSLSALNSRFMALNITLLLLSRRLMNSDDFVPRSSCGVDGVPLPGLRAHSPFICMIAGQRESDAAHLTSAASDPRGWKQPQPWKPSLKLFTRLRCWYRQFGCKHTHTHTHTHSSKDGVRKMCHWGAFSGVPEGDALFLLK